MGVQRRPSRHMTAVVFQMHAGDNCWHCYRTLHCQRRPAQYIVGVKPAQSEATWQLVASAFGSVAADTAANTVASAACVPVYAMASLIAKNYCQTYTNAQVQNAGHLVPPEYLPLRPNVSLITGQIFGGKCRNTWGLDTAIVGHLAPLVRRLFQIYIVSVYSVISTLGECLTDGVCGARHIRWDSGRTDLEQ